MSLTFPTPNEAYTEMCIISWPFITVLQPALHEALSKVSWLLGKWRGEGCGTYPTIPPFTYGEEVIFDHVGQPMLSYK